jgi:nicotinamidase-related amidase
MEPNTQPFTLRSVAGLPDSAPGAGDSVIIVIDAQIEYTTDGKLPLPGTNEAVDRIDAIIGRARATATPVIHVAHQGRAGGLFDPEHGGRIIAQVSPADGEVIVTKTLPNAFAGTELQLEVERTGRTSLVLVGFMTHMCVSSTARAALDFGLESTVISDACATRSLPSADGQSDMPADTIHTASLAALADRFCVVTDSATLTEQWGEPRA